MRKYIDADEAVLEIERHLRTGDEVYPLSAEDRALDDGLIIAADVVYRHPAADVVEVVRCASCKYQDKGENDCEAWNLCGYRPWLHIPTEDDAFCSKGERKDG